MPYRYPPEFRRRVLDLLAAGRPVASLSKDLGMLATTSDLGFRGDTTIKREDTTIGRAAKGAPV